MYYISSFVYAHHPFIFHCIYVFVIFVFVYLWTLCLCICEFCICVFAFLATKVKLVTGVESLNPGLATLRQLLWHNIVNRKSVWVILWLQNTYISLQENTTYYYTLLCITIHYCKHLLCITIHYNPWTTPLLLSILWCFHALMPFTCGGVAAHPLCADITWIALFVDTTWPSLLHLLPGGKKKFFPPPKKTDNNGKKNGKTISSSRKNGSPPNTSFHAFSLLKSHFCQSSQTCSV